MNIAFFGTSDRSVPIIKALKEAFNLVLCVTKNDTLVGRKQEKKETEVKKWSKENNIPYVTISSLQGSDLENVIKHLNDSKVDYCLVADFGFMIPADLLNSFENKFINIHFSLLPKYRGSSPVQQAILEGDEYTGITYLLVTKKLDAGDIIKQIGYKMSGNETSEQLYGILFELASENVSKIITEYDQGLLKPIKQDLTQATYTYSPTHPTSTQIYKEDAIINWKDEPIKIERKIRALNSWPIAKTTLENLEKNSKLHEKIRLKNKVKKDLSVKVYTAQINNEGKLKIDCLQIEGKDKMTWEDFINGYVETTK